jgi:aminomethyltransferase
MRRSPLHQLNESLGARFVDFGGWEMPVQYESVLAEHRAVRSEVGVFDVTHLGRFSLTGPGAQKTLSDRLCNDIDRISPGRCQYTMLLNERGGIVDDLIVWWCDDRTFWVMPNAANHEKVMGEFRSALDCEVDDLQEDTVFLAVQGPGAPEMIEAVVGTKPGRFRNTATDWRKSRLSMAGTGYTGEPGAELCVAAADSEDLMRAFLDAGATPCGLGARDTLRLEAGLPLWGEDIDETTTPLEAGLDFAVSLDNDFVGRDALVRQSESGLERKLAGLVLEDRGIPRHGYEVRAAGGGEGLVTSGNISPLLDCGVALAYMRPPAELGAEVEVSIRDRWVAGRVVDPPFHTQTA